MIPTDTPSLDPLAFLKGTDQLGELMAGFDWSATSLGQIGAWPQSVKTAVSLILRSPVPIATMWGADGYLIYNSGYASIAGSRHPALLGTKVREGWSEVADFNDNVMRTVMGGGTLAYVDTEMTLQRAGRDEKTWFNLGYSPVTGEDSKPIGVIALVIETTARVRAEQYQSGERDRLETMFQQAPGFMAMLTGPEHVFTLANTAYSELVGHRPVLGKSVREALPEAAQQGFVDLLDGLYRSGQAYSGTAVPWVAEATEVMPARDRFVDFVYQPLRNAAGEAFGIFVQGSDVTDRVRAEQSLRDSETTFRTLAQALPNQVWAAPPDGVPDWFNERVYAYAGMRFGDLDQGRWLGIVHPDDVAAATSAWAEANRLGEIYEIEFRLRRADGLYRWHLARALPILDEAGAVMRWVGANTDIDDQKAAAALAYLNQTLAQQVGQRTAERDRMWRLSTELMLVADFNASISAVNPAFTTVLGWRADEVVGMPLIDLVHPGDVAATLAEVAGLGQGRTTFSFENRYRHRNGSYRILCWSAAPDEGCIHAVGRDVTSEREAAATMRLTEKALQQAQKMETIGKLTGGVAHDFNNLLQVISGNLQLLRSDVGINVRAQRRVDNAMEGVARGAKLASHLLAFGRRQALEPKVVKIGRYVAAMEDMLRRTLGEAIEVETVIPGGLWNTCVDTAQVENAVLNLCINARDAMDGVGKLTIEVGNAMLDDDYVRAHPDVSAGQYVVIGVRDTGSGMAPEVMAQAFEPFFSTKPEGQGTGLGLSMVYGFAKQSGGHVKIHSKVGVGTTVKLYLPRSMEAEDVLVPVDMRPPTGGTETILVAEDDEGVRETVVEMLGELGYRVLKASDAASALAIVASGIPIDLLFTDVVMPGSLRSPDLARKARESLPDLAVLYTSGYTENAIGQGGRLDPGVALLRKPYTREALAQKIRHVLANRQQRSSNAGAAATVSVQQLVQQVTPPCLKIMLVEDDDFLRRELSGRAQGASRLASLLLASQSRPPSSSARAMTAGGRL